jgi:hypothetical protein
MKTENMGWQCPNCLVIYSPSVINCWCSSLPKEPTVSLSGGSIVGVGGTGNVIRDVTSSTAQICFGYISESPNGVCSKCGQPEWHHHNISYT